METDKSMYKKFFLLYKLHQSLFMMMMMMMMSPFLLIISALTHTHSHTHIHTHSRLQLHNMLYTQKLCLAAEMKSLHIQ